VLPYGVINVIIIIIIIIIIGLYDEAPVMITYTVI